MTVTKHLLIADYVIDLICMGVHHWFPCMDQQKIRVICDFLIITSWNSTDIFDLLTLFSTVFQNQVRKIVNQFLRYDKYIFGLSSASQTRMRVATRLTANSHQLWAGWTFDDRQLKMRYSPICACAQRIPLYLQTVYLGFYFILCSCKAWLSCLHNLLYSRIMKI
jgi:hypothetical protein